MSGVQGQRKPPNRRTSTLYISGLDPSVSDKDLRDECAKFGAIKRVTIIKDKETRVSKGFGYLLFRSEDEASKALKELDGRVIADKPVKCKYSFSETPEWQMILDNRRNQQNGGPPMRGRGAPRARGRGQGRGYPMFREPRPPRFDNDQSVYERPQRGGYMMPRGRGGPGPRGRGILSARGAPNMRGGAGAGRGESRLPKYERNEADQYQDPYENSYGAPLMRERPDIATREGNYDSYNRQSDRYDRPPAQYGERQASQYNERQPPTAYEREGGTYGTDRQQSRYVEREPLRYEERQDAIYGERRPLPDQKPPTSSSRPYSDLDPYDSYASRSLPPRESDSRVPINREPMPRGLARDPYSYGSTQESNRNDIYDQDRFGDHTPVSTSMSDRSYSSLPARDRAAPMENTSRDPYDSTRKRPAQGYAGYNDIYDQPPARVSRGATREGYNY